MKIMTSNLMKLSLKFLKIKKISMIYQMKLKKIIQSYLVESLKKLE